MNLLLNCYYVVINIALTSLALVSSSMDVKLEAIGPKSFSTDEYQDMAANIPHSRKKRFIAFPGNSSLLLETYLEVPIDKIPGVSQFQFQTDYLFPLDVIFPLPIDTTTNSPVVTVLPTTTRPPIKYGAPPATTLGYKTSYGHRGPPHGNDIGFGPPKGASSPKPSSYSSYASSKIDSIEGFNRLPLYEYLEDFLNSRGYNGKQCTLRTLCEVADAPFDHGLYGEIVNLIMSASMNPTKAGEYDDYMVAEYYGKHFGDCHKIYHKCPESVLGLVSGVFQI